ncbi:hypothetical protein ACP8HI_20430 [Paenibacillus sp. FA6]|uniref:hypothetical protein n=1 Tax=Paenibacillus sp. FA6 TaxID=3413029 RepID=UPI003F655BE5
MKNILIGNGITIQFGGSDYLNSNILKRVVNNIKEESFPKEIYPMELEQWIQYLFSQLNNILDGVYDLYVVTESDNMALSDFKQRYKSRNWYTTFHSLGFEDYFFIHNLVCIKNGVVNPEKYNTREALRVSLLDSIYNSGKINMIHKKYPLELRDYFQGYNNIFTTNYDNNIEVFSDREVNYLHGAFHILDDVYNPDSLRNQLSDRPLDSGLIVSGYDHLYSNALTTYSGETKDSIINMRKSANIAISKFVDGMQTKPELMSEIEEWKESDNQIVRNMYESIMIKLENPEVSFSEYDALQKFSDIEGSITILGLSPNNDNHIFKEILNNQRIDEIIYYFYDESEGNRVRNLFGNKKVTRKDVKKFWEQF